MNYTDTLIARKAEGKGKRVTTEIHSWKEAGEVVAGKLIRVEPFTKGKFEGEVSAYIIDTGDSLVSTVIGAHTDEQIIGSYEPGDFIMIEFQGKKSVADGKRANIFQVTIFKVKDVEADETISDAIGDQTNVTGKKGKGRA